ncbi:MAG: ABC transporter ATP-binding protein [Deltaproteobacteria bacterium]|nr:ABC transporter ATP-binding protein [Deltaproteobacteria bacterium]
MIRVSDLSFRYINQPGNALCDVAFAVPGGETVLFSGPTGCGKSTLGLVLCGAIPNLIPGTLSGSVFFDGKSLAGRTVRQTARDLGFLMQNVENQIFTERVCDEIAFGLENFCVPSNRIEEKIEEALHLVNGEHLFNRRLGTLSTGERQRVMLAAALAMDQKVLVLDEPLAYLDPKAQQLFVELMFRLAQKGKTILVFEHRRDAMEAVVHREIYMDGGRICSGPPVQQYFEHLNGYPPKDAVLAVEELSFSWKNGEPPLLAGISLEVRQHESVVLLGENGSGKTTLLHLAMGFFKPSQGKIFTCGHDTRRFPVSNIVGLAMLILQQPDHQLYMHRVRDEILSQAVDTNAAQEELAALGLQGFENHHPRSLSTGQKRRLTLAAALARRPKLMLLDEPSVGQDDMSLTLIVKRLNRFVRDGGALLTATHDIRVARALGHRVLKLKNGRLEKAGSLEIQASGGHMKKCKQCRE